ncbi:MAG: hypothetical protein OXU20_07610 [Myxococcales bacterium]|nr:hypothetical protein [Myxococcales bacterium]MDD9965555.1 hypothetical protein [Myxococcales bacterium]
MTSIKPPGGKHPLDGATGASLDVGAEAVSATATETDKPVAAGVGVSSADGVSEAGSVDQVELGPLEALSADLASGRIAPEAAVEALVQRALADVAGVLSAEQLQDLEATLRAVFADDPTMSALRADWG